MHTTNLIRTMESDTEPEVPRKLHKVGQDKRISACVICNVKSLVDDLTSPKDWDSWRSLLTAAEIQCCDELLKYKDKTEVPKVLYHLNCRKTFTHKKTLQRLQKEEGPSCANKESLQAKIKRKRESKSTSRVLDKVCIFCDKVSKYAKGSNTREPLCQSVDLRSDATVRHVAVQKMDTRIMGLTSRELVATEAHYHRSCYRSYTRQKEETSTDQAESDDERLYSLKEVEAYKMLFDFVRTDLFVKPRILPMTHLSKQLVANMNTLGIEEIKKTQKNTIGES